MKRKTSQRPTFILTYGCGPVPEATLQLLRDCLVETTEYYNALCDLNVQRAERFRKIRAEAIPELPAVEAEIDALSGQIDESYEALRRERARVRKRIDVAAITDKIELLKASRKAALATRSELAKTFAGLTKPAREEYKRRKKESGVTAPRLVEKLNAKLHDEMLSEPGWPEPWKAQQQNERAALAELKLLRSKSEPWCYLLTERAFDTARAKVASGVPQPKRDSREGRVGLQVRNLSARDLFSPGGNFWIERQTSAWVPGDTGTIAHLKLGAKRIQLPIVLQRPLPDDAITKWAWVMVERVGPRLVCSLQLTIETMQMGSPHGTGVVAFDLAWRKTEHGVRVGYWVSEDGESGQIELTAAQMSSIAYADKLRSIGDLVFDRAKARLERWLRWSARSTQGIPEWLALETETIAQWRGHGRLAGLAYRWARALMSEEAISHLWDAWRRERLAKPKKDLFASLSQLSTWFRAHGITDPTTRLALYLEWWRRKNRHLYEWESNQRRSSLLMRKDVYRNVAARLRKQFGKLIIADTDLRNIQERAPDDKDETSWAASRLQRQRACPSELRRIICEKVPEVVKVKSSGLTSQCADCGGSFVHNKETFGTCAACGVRRDADENHCLNLLSATGHRPAVIRRERSGDEQSPGTAREKPTVARKRGRKNPADAAV
jgi:hypothetical protein